MWIVSLMLSVPLSTDNRTIQTKTIGRWPLYFKDGDHEIHLPPLRLSNHFAEQMLSAKRVRVQSFQIMYFCRSQFPMSSTAGNDKFPFMHSAFFF